MKQIWQRFTMVTVTAALVGVGLFTTSGAAQAAPSADVVSNAPAAAAAAGQACRLGAPRVAKYDRFEGWRTVWPNRADWSVQGYGPGRLSLRKSVSVANQVTMTTTVSKSVVSAAVGFSVTKTYQTASSYSITMKDRHLYTIEAGHRDAVYVYHIYEKQGSVVSYPRGSQCVFNGKLKYVGWGRAYNYHNLVYRSHRS
jgi:hypothetical protein